MKRFLKYVSFVAISIALATACEKVDESALPNIPLKLSTDDGSEKAVVLTLEKGKVLNKFHCSHCIPTNSSPLGSICSLLL